MDLSDLARPTAPATHLQAECLDPQTLVAQLGSEVASALSAALDRVAAISASNAFDRESLHALRHEISLARRAGIMGQQVVRLGSGQVRLTRERVDLSALLLDLLRQRGREFEDRGIEIRQHISPAQVMSDATLLFSLLQTMWDWAFEHAVSRMDIALEVRGWPASACLQLAFAHLPPDAMDEGALATSSADDAAALNTVSWCLLRQTAAVLGLRLQRRDQAGRTTLGLEFPDAVAQRMDPAGTTSFEEPVAPTRAQPFAGRHVLVLAGRREVRHSVREALRPMGMMVDYVDSVDEMQQQCVDALPDAVIYESSLAGQRFDRLRDEWLARAPRLAFVHIAEQGRTTEQLNLSGRQITSVGRDAIVESLPEALRFELARHAQP